MKNLVIDFEMNEVKDSTIELSNEIIEIGAVILDEGFNEIKTYKKYICPKFNRLTYHVRKITKLSDELLQHENSFSDAMKDFLNWIDSIVGDEFVNIYQWSTNDKYNLLKEATFKCFPKKHFIFNQEWEDAQLLYSQKVLGTNQQVSLTNALKYAEISFIGMEHDATSDARSTAALLRFLFDEKSINRVKEAERLKEKYMHFQQCTLGELIDFSLFDLYKPEI